MADETFCPYCGASMKAGASFCPSCGAQIPKPGEAAPASAQPSYAQPAGGYYKEKKSSLKTIGIITIVLAVIAILGAIAALLLSGAVDSMYDQLIKENPDLFKEISVEEFKKMMNASAIIMLVLGVVGIVGAICCIKSEHYILGLVMYIIALVINCVDIVFNGVLLAAPGIIIAIVLLVVYIKGKQSFSS